ncbi:ATP synthase D chain [Aureococcus anophagefferens]|nr:ATP synthase D chain [Aureococcus anophagefferens]
MLARSTRAVARAARTQRWVSVAALESKVTTDEAKQELNRLKMALGEASLLAAKYSAAPAPIDFAAYKGKVDDSLLALFEKEYKAVSYPAFTELDDAKADYDAMFAEATEKIAESKTRISELTAQMNTMIAKKVGPTTTVEDVYAAYPDIEKEIDEEIDQHQWSKDI